MMAWSMDKEEYFEFKKAGLRDKEIAKRQFVSTRTMDRWKKAEGIYLGINKRHDSCGRLVYCVNS
jgi:hypothetical protein